VGLKNDLLQIKDLVSYFDFAYNEQCYQYGECDKLTPFILQGKAVFQAEYQGNLTRICAKAKSLKMDAVLMDMDVTGKKSQRC